MTIGNISTPPLVRLAPSPDPVDLTNRTFFPVLPIETRARSIANENYSSPEMMALVTKIKNCLGMLDLYRDNGFVLCQPETILSALLVLCSRV